GLVGVAVKAGAAALLMGGGITLALPWLEGWLGPLGTLGDLLLVGVCGAGGAGFYLTLAALLGLEEMALLRQAVAARWFRRG
ncbi:MAG: hypothetical protein ACP5UM_15085, partial [Anaerolineae bacterium]